MIYIGFTIGVPVGMVIMSVLFRHTIKYHWTPQAEADTVRASRD